METQHADNERGANRVERVGVSGEELSVGLIGFGEAGRAFASGWTFPLAGRVAAYDIKAADPRTAPFVRSAAAELGMSIFDEPGPALANAGLGLCLVTADQAVNAAAAAASHLRPGTIWLDGNSCAPGSKQRAAAIIDEAGGRYVDMAIMAPVAPKRHRTPCLLSGPHAEAACAALAGLDMDVRIAGTRVGDAAAIKMLRSVMVKGLEALVAECLLAARRAGVENEVLASLQASDPEWDWRARGDYNLERMLVHGARRAAEMREAAVMLRELGLPDRMTRAAAEWEDAIAGLVSADAAPDFDAKLDAILARLK
jgi:3-hydroxyisobutyrate dehydrogenase-like beta-hydroxyacid dehydrogenase